MLGAETPLPAEPTTFTVAVTEKGGRQSVVGAACHEDVAFALFRAVAAAYPDKTVILRGADRVQELAVRPRLPG
jgi:hypothetical protein